MVHTLPWWVGVRPSDVSGIEALFSGCISIIGAFPETVANAFSIETQIGRRLNHNAPGNEELIEKALLSLIGDLRQSGQNLRFLFQDQLSFSQSPLLSDVACCNNPLGLVATLNDKGYSRALIGRHVETVGSTLMFARCLSYEGLRDMFPGARRFVVQKPVGAGGHGSVLIDGQEALSRLAPSSSIHVVVSEYVDGALPLNQHLVIFPDRVLLLPPSAQVLSEGSQGEILYAGCDFSTPNRLPLGLREEIERAGRKIGDFLRAAGYLGVAGIDYLVSSQKVLFVEINPRFQASTARLNRILLDHRLPSAHEMHMQAFYGGVAPALPKELTGSGAVVFFAKTKDSAEVEAGHQQLKSPDSRATAFARDSINLTVDLEGLADGITVDEGAMLGRLETDRSIVWFDPSLGTLNNSAVLRLGRKPQTLVRDARNGDVSALARLKFHLFSYGARLLPSALERLAEERKDLTIRDGIAGGLEIRLPGRVHVNLPIKEYFALLSPFGIDWQDGGYHLIDCHGDALPMDVLPLPDFISKSTSRGTPMVEVGQMFNERLSIEVFFGCVNTAQAGTACHFCELGAEPTQSYAEISDIRELVAYCETSPTISMRHVLIGGGTPPEPRWSMYYDAIAAVKSQTEVPIYIMLAPPNRLERLDELHTHGVAEIGMNIELYDRKIARHVMPAKGRIGLDRYFRAFDRAVSLWGGNGAVRSILIVGLEPLGSTLAGVEALCQRGVMPILSPYRPVPNTPLADLPPPSPEMMYQAWIQGEAIARRYGLRLGPTCIACQNNTITMPIGQDYRYY